MILNILAFIAVLGITITIHELGHFLMAKYLKIRVLVFSLGFGPRLWGFTRGGTEYRISPIPLGGYVKMAGETFDEGREGAPDEFLSHPKRHRFLVAVAGPAMNVALAVVILAITYMYGTQVYRYPTQPAVVGPVAAYSQAARAGLQSGDRIIAVGGNRVQTWQEMEIAVGTAPKGNLEFTIRRGSEQRDISIRPREGESQDPASLGFKHTLPQTIVSSVDPGSPAARAGLEPGDEILSVRRDDRYGAGYDEILNVISESQGVPLDFEVLRKAGKAPAERRHLTITPYESGGRVIIGFFPEVPYDTLRYGLWGALSHSVRSNYQMATMTFKILGRMIRGTASLKTLSGPIGIAQMSGSAARSGSARFFFGFIAMVSLQLGIFNLLPIPILDGGVITLLAIEGVIGRDLSMGLKEKIVQAGFVFLILLMGFVIFNDLSKLALFGRLFG